jgi:hydrogenase maturation protease
MTVESLTQVNAGSQPSIGAPILVAGIGNVFLGDDGFGVEVARLLAEIPLPDSVRVVDFGIRGMDLAFALGDGYSAIILVDCAPRGEPPGTLSLIEPSIKPDGHAELETHRMDPVKALRFAATLGAPAIPTFLVACEPASAIPDAACEDVVVDLSPPVQEAVPRAVEMVEALIARLLSAKAG